MEVAGVIINVDLIITVTSTEMREPTGFARPGTRIELRDKPTPLILPIEFAEFRRLLDRLLNLHVTEGETVRRDRWSK